MTAQPFSGMPAVRFAPRIPRAHFIPVDFSITIGVDLVEAALMFVSEFFTTEKAVVIPIQLFKNLFTLRRFLGCGSDR